MKTVIHAKTTEEFKSAELVAALNNGRTGGAAPWVQGALYPELKNIGAYVPDETAPELTAGEAQRPSDAAATVKFTSSEDGTYYYAVVESGADIPTIDTDTDGTPCGTDEQTITLSNLTAGAKDIYIVVADAAGNESEPLKIEIPAYQSSGGGGSGGGGGGSGGADPGTGGGTDPGTGGNGETPATPIDPPVTPPAATPGPVVDEIEIISTPDSDNTTVAVVPVVPQPTLDNVSKVVLTGDALSTAIDLAVSTADSNGSVPTLEIEARAPAEKAEDVKVVEVEIPANSIKEVAASGVEEVKITTVIGEVVLDKTAIEALADQAGAAVTLSIGRLDDVSSGAANANNLNLTQSQIAEIEADAEIREVFDVSLLVGGNHVTNFDKDGQKGALTISLPYELGSGEAADRVGVNYIDENGSSTPVSGAIYSNGYVEFQTDHLSVYAVVYRAAPDPDPDPKDQGTSSGGCDAGFAGFALLALGAVKARRRG